MTGTHLDITQSKTAQDALQRTQRKYQEMVELLPQPVFELNAAGNISFINEKGFELFGYSPDEFERGVHFSRLLALQEVDPAGRNIQRVLDGEQIGGQEYLALRKDGSTFPVLVHAALTKLDDGTNGIRGIIADLTEIKKAGESLRKSEAKYRDLVDSSPDLVFTRDAQQRLTSVNSAIEGLLGYRPEEFLQMEMSQIIHPDFLPIVENNFRAKIEGHTDRTGPYEIVAIAKDKRHVWLDFNSRVRRQDGRIQGVHVTARDVSDRKRAEKISRRRTEELEAINSLGHEINSRLSLSETVNRGLATIISVIRADCAMLFLREDDDLVLQGAAPDSDLVGPRFTPIHRVGECLCGLTVRDGKALFSSNINNDPRCTWTECKQAGLRSIASIPLVDMDRIFGVLAIGSYSQRDFSTQSDFIQSLAHEINMGLKNSLLFEEAKRHADELEEKLAELKRANEAKDLLQSQLLQAQKMEAIGRLAGGIAHDFNNLLTVMVGYSDMLKSSFPENSQQGEKLRQIGRAADRASSLTRQLLAFSRKQVLDVKVIDLNDVLMEMENMLKRLLGEDIELRGIYGASPAFVKADKDQIGQIIMNIAVNARDAMHGGGKLTIETTNTILDAAYIQGGAEIEPGRYVVMAFSDNGVGMNAEIRGRIFEPFFTTKGKEVGTGLGLSTVFGIAKQHKGHVTVYSEPGKGSTFRIYFPQVGDSAQPIRETCPSPTVRHGGETILVVEDEEFVRDYTCEALSLLGYVTLSAKNPQRAIELSAQHAGVIHLLLTDVVLPQMDGRTLFESLLSMRPDLRALYMSGYTDDAIVRHGVLESGVHFLQKPFGVGGLAKKVGEALGGANPVSAACRAVPEPEAQGMEDNLALHRVAALPPELIEELNQAAQEANMRKMAEAILRVRRHDEELAEFLQGLLKRCRFDKIISFIEDRANC